MGSSKSKISRERAADIEDAIISETSQFFEKWMAVGSVRRNKPEVNDLDILVIPRKGGGMVELAEWAKKLKDGNRLLSMGASKMQILYQGVQVDIYFATAENWITLLVIRTGSAQHNIKLCSQAKKLGMVLHADGRGIYTKGGSKLEPIPNSEEEFFNALGLPYLRPEEREIYGM